MEKVISYSLYGDKPKYTVGMFRNIELAEELYPDWTVYVYHNNTISDDFIWACENFTNLKLIDMSQYNMPGMFWRFMPHDKVELFIVRDADSRLSMREKLAVDEWIESGKSLHIMRDHPHHGYKMLGGMWGFRNKGNFHMISEIGNYLRGHKYDLYKKMIDMDFLRDVVYPRFVEDSIIHDSVFQWEEHAKSFPTKMEDCRFVGEIINEDESREYQYNEWVNREEL